MSKPSLEIYEWLAVLLLIALMSMITAVSLLKRNDLPSTISGQAHYIQNPEITVYIEGAVKSPGALTVKRGSTLADAINQIELTEEADLSKIKLHSKIRKNQCIKIPKKIKKGKKSGYSL